MRFNLALSNEWTVVSCYAASFKSWDLAAESAESAEHRLCSYSSDYSATTAADDEENTHWGAARAHSRQRTLAGELAAVADVNNTPGLQPHSQYAPASNNYNSIDMTASWFSLKYYTPVTVLSVVSVFVAVTVTSRQWLATSLSLSRNEHTQWVNKLTTTPLDHFYWV